MSFCNPHPHPPTHRSLVQAWQSMCFNEQMSNTKFDSFPHKPVPPLTFPSPTLITVVPGPCNLETILDSPSSCASVTHCPTFCFFLLSNVCIRPFLFVLTASLARSRYPHLWLLQDCIDFFKLCVFVIFFYEFHFRTMKGSSPNISYKGGTGVGRAEGHWHRLVECSSPGE